tara:strand:- start:3107 stop:3940 length:834 start_codon:yes stop_codon:yes gene_type:complete
MKNVFKRCLKLITLFDNSNQSNIDSNYIKDNIPEYRNLSDGAFKRSFERDKLLLKEVGYNLEYENDKWNLDDGYKLKGLNIVNDLKKNKDFNFEQFATTYSVIKRYLSPQFNLEQSLKIIPKLSIAAREKRRVSFIYNENLRKVYPLGLRYHTGTWYLGAEDNKVIKTFKISKIKDLKIGSKDNLHEIEVKEFNFSWEYSAQEVSVEFKTIRNLHNVYKSLVNFVVINTHNEESFKHLKIKTRDHYGLIKYLMLTEAEITKISKKDATALQEAINGI